jgi:UDP-N-acetylglucosamine 2-epimerase (non-hydrolysing)
MTYSDIAREYLLREGLSPDRIIKTGSPMFEVLNYYMPKIAASDVLERLGLEKGNYFVVSAHREENISNDKTFFGLLEALNRIAEQYGHPVIVSTHPRTRKRLEQLSNSDLLSVNSDQLKEDTQEQTIDHTSRLTHRSPITDYRSQITLHPLIQWQKPLGFSDYNALQLDAYAVLSDSGTISEESSTLNFRALNIREAHERPEAMEEASVMMVGLNPERIMQGLLQLQHQDTTPREASQITDYRSQITHTPSAVTLRPVADYSMPNVSEKVVRIILSYTEYVNRTVWKKD